MDFSLAIDDDLAEELCKFRTNQQCDVDRVEKTLHYYKGYPLFTKSYFKRYYADKSIQSNVLQSTSHIDWNSLESVCKSTIYKVILSSQRNVSFPYVSIYDDKIESNFTATFFKNEPRQKALSHLNDLLSVATEISIYDIHLLKQKWNRKSFAQFCKLLPPTNKLTIKYLGGNTNSKVCKIMERYVCKMYPNWHWVVQNYIKKEGAYAHDRYLIIDNKIEVIFTSGIHHLINTDKDFTYIVRQYKNN